MSYWVHRTAIIDQPTPNIGDATMVWAYAHIREDAVIGEQCVIGEGVYVDHGVTIGNKCKIQNGAYLYHPAVIKDNVFVGPRVMLLNDRYPRACNEDGSLKRKEDWDPEPVVLMTGCSVGAGAIILPGVTIGAGAIIAAGAVVTRSVESGGIVRGIPAG